MFLLNFINWLLNLPVKPIEASHAGDLVTLAILLGWLYLVSVGLLLTIAVALYVIQTVPQVSATLLRRVGRTKASELLFFELTFPANTNKSAHATEQLHILLRSLSRHQNLLDRIAGYKERYSLELVSTKDEGIRYVLAIPAHDADRARQSLLSFLPGLRVRQVADPVRLREGYLDIRELKLGANFAFPLKEHKALADHDPIAFLTGHMTKLDVDEVIALQIVASPVYQSTHPWVTSHIRRIQSLIASGKQISGELHRRIPKTLQICLMLPFWIVVDVLRFILAIITSFIHHSSTGSYGAVDAHHTYDLYEQELVSLIKSKLDQHLFEVSIRILVNAKDEARMNQRLENITTAFDMFDSSRQAIVRRSGLPVMRSRQTKWRFDRFQKRLLTPTFLYYGSFVSASELADLYHFPNTDVTKTEGLIKTRTKDLPIPLSMRRSDTDLDVIIGHNYHGSSDELVGLTLEQRQKHLYVIGKTGTGKTTLLTNMIYRDMVNGKGLAVFDPHGDMFHELLEIVPEHRRKDVVVFDPSDRDWPVGLNILDPGIPFASKDEEHEWIASAVVSVFERLSEPAQWGPRMEHILRNATLTALQLPNPTLYTIQRLLTEKSYQREAAKQLDDPILRQFWAKEFKLMGTMQLSNAVSPLTHRLGHFITTKLSRHILLQEKSTLRMADIMNEGKILLVNLSKGDIGEDQSAFFGTMLSSLVWLAAYQRTKIPEAERKDFFLYVDEFQNFATKQFSEIMSEGRKFHLSLITSHQNIAQIEDTKTLQIVAGNAASILTFKVSPNDEAFILPFMRPEVERGDMVNLAPHHFYLKTTTDASEDACSGETVPLQAIRGSDMAAAVIEHSRHSYGMLAEKVAELVTGLTEQTRRSKKADSDSLSTVVAPPPAEGLVEG